MSFRFSWCCKSSNNV